MFWPTSERKHRLPPREAQSRWTLQFPPLLAHPHPWRKMVESHDHLCKKQTLVIYLLIFRNRHHSSISKASDLPKMAPKSPPSLQLELAGTLGPQLIQKKTSTRISGTAPCGCTTEMFSLLWAFHDLLASSVIIFFFLFSCQRTEAISHHSMPVWRMPKGRSSETKTTFKIFQAKAFQLERETSPFLKLPKSFGAICFCKSSRAPNFQRLHTYDFAIRNHNYIVPFIVWLVVSTFLKTYARHWRIILSKWLKLWIVQTTNQIMMLSGGKKTT